MKAMFALILFAFSTLTVARAIFLPLTSHSATHELTWNFPKAVTGWGKKDVSQVILKCDGEPLEKPSSVYWVNAQTLKLVPAKNFMAGSKCVANLNLEIEKQEDHFTIPLVTVISILPYESNSLQEDTSFVLGFDGPVDEDLIADIAHVEVEGVREKVELDAVKGDLKNEVLAHANVGGTTQVVLKPRRIFPFDKKIVLTIPQKYTTAYSFQGKIREDFNLKMTCERSKTDAPCSPLSKISVNFSAEVSPGMAKKVVLHQGKNSWKIPDNDQARVSFITFAATLLPNTEYSLTLDGSLEDLDKRELSNKKNFPLKFKTANFPPLAKFPGSFGILESNAIPMLPVSVRNIEKKINLKKTTAVLTLNNPKIFARWLDTIDKRQDMGYDEDTELRAKSIFTGSVILTKDEILNYSLGKNETEVLGLEVKQKGLHLVELSSPLIAGTLLQNQPNFFISTAVLVTNLSAHLKIGQTESMVWVTTLDRAEVVEGAQVIFYDCSGQPIEKGITNSKGIFLTSKVGKKNLECSSSLPNLVGKVLVVASKQDDATFTMSSWNQGIEPWRFGLPYYSSSTDFQKAHTVFDRPLYKMNEKVHMLHLLRSQGDDGLIYPQKKNQFTHIKIYHESGKEWLLPVAWKDLGSGVTEFIVPENAPQGYFYVVLTNAKGEMEGALDAGQFIVKDFRVPLMRSEVHFKDRKESFVRDEKIQLLGHLEYLAGGNSSFTAVTLRGQLSPLFGTQIQEFSEYSFNFSGAEKNQEANEIILEKKVTRTDKSGDFSFEIKDLKLANRVYHLNSEIEYLDPNGVFETNSTHTTIYPFDKLIGIKPPAQIYAGKEANYKVVIINQKKVALKNIGFTGSLYHEVYTSTRKKIIGGFYTYDSSNRTENIGEVCKGTTDRNGEANCSFKMDKAGTYTLVLETKDKVVGSINSYVYGNDYEWTPVAYNDRADLIPDQPIYHPGETAKIEMKLPFEKATVLVTKERSGIKDTYLMPYDRTNPFITVPIEKNDFPNFYLSALAVRGRIGEPTATGLVDLAKPSYKIGLKEIRVDRNDNNLKIVLTPEKEKFQVRDTVKVKVKVATMDGSPLGSTQVALSVFDEGLLLLNGQNSFDAASSLITSYTHGVLTATAQTHVIGKRHFGLKARAHGGGGGKDLKPRELFDTLIYWNPRLALDKNGEALVTFKLNDSLTSFKIYGLAYSQEKFGNSNTRIISSQDIMSFIGTSPEIRTGDQFNASYTLKNISSSDKDLRAELFLDGKQVKEEKFIIKSTESHVFTFAATPFAVEKSATWLLNLYDGKKKIDAIKTMQKVSALEKPRVEFSDLKELKEPVELKALTSNPNLFGTEIILSSKLTPSLQSLQDFMKSYQYNCLEQKLARATILEDKTLWNKLNRDLSSYVDSRGFLKYYPVEEEKGSFLLTTHFMEVTYWNQTPTLQDAKIEGALTQLASGYITDLNEWEKRDYKNLRTKAMVTLKIRKSKSFQDAWLKEISSPRAEDDLMTLMDKWVLFYPSDKSSAAHDMIQSKLKIDGSMVTLPGEEKSPFYFLYSLNSTLYGRFLLLQKTMGLKGDLDTFFAANEGKFIRGYLSLRQDGHFGGTTANTYAYLLQKRWESKVPVTGTTKVADVSSAWKNNSAASLFLNKEKSSKDQILKHDGAGTPWADIRTLTYPKKDASVSQGIELKFNLQNLEPHSNFQVQDRVQAKILVIVKNDLPMGAITLSLPSGVTVIDSQTNLYLNYEERTESKWRGYFNFIQKGSYEITVSFRLNQVGSFEVPGARMEAMYSPDLFGEAPFWKMKVE